MKIYNELNLVKNPSGSFLFFDTNSLIAVMTYQEDFRAVFSEFKMNDYTFITIPSVVFEFTRTDSINKYNNRNKFINSFLSVFEVEKILGQIREITPVLQKINGRMSYSDFLLYCCLYKFPNSYLITENHKDFLTSILDRTGLLTLDNESETIRNIGLYTFSHGKYQKAAENILRNG
jgi:hypothetical protein